MNNEVKLGQMIRYYLSQNNMTMKQLGELLDKTESTVSKWIKGTSSPQITELSKMTFIFKTDMNTLMYGAADIDSIIKVTNIMRELDEVDREKVCKFALKLLEKSKKEKES